MFNVRLLNSKNPKLSRQARLQVASANIILTKLDRTITGSTKVQVGDGSAQRYPLIKPPAWSLSDGTRVFINYKHDAFKRLAGERAFAHVLGLNYHELAHLLYTPDTNILTAMRSAVIRRNGRDAFNMLEDGRIERLIGAEYPSVKPFLTNTYVTIVISANNPESLWPITAPRIGVLPKSIVDAVRQSILTMPTADRAWTNAELREMSTIARKYRTFVFPKNDREGAALVERYALLLDKFNRKQKQTGGNDAPVDQHEGEECGHQAGSYRSDVKRRDESQQEELQKRADTEEANDPSQGQNGKGQGQQSKSDEQGDQDGNDSGTDAKGDKGEGAESEGSGSDQGDDGDQDGDGQGDDGAEGDADGQQDGQQGQGQGQGDSDSQDQAQDGFGSDMEGGGKGAGHGTTTLAQAKANMDDAVDRAIEEVLSDANVVDQLDMHRRAMRSGHAFVPTKDHVKATQHERPSQAMTMTAKRAGAEFRKLQASLDPGWEKRTPIGKLNVQRFMRERDLDNAFDHWREDKSDAADVEACLFLDMSASMGGYGVQHYIDAARAFWVIRKALAAINAKVTGYGFSDDASVLFQREESVPDNKVDIWGTVYGTYLWSALEDATALMVRSQAKTRVMIVVTDGEYSDDVTRLKDKLDELRSYGLVLVQFYIGDDDYAISRRDMYKNSFDVSVDVTNAEQMVQPVKELVKRLIKQKARR